MQPDLSGFQIDLRIEARDRAHLQVYNSVFSKSADRLSCLCVEGSQPVASSDVQNAVVTFAIGPVGQSTPGELPGRHCGARALADAVRPDQFAGFRIQCHHRPPRTRGCIDDAFHHQRRTFQLVLGTGTQTVRLETPRYFEFVEVGSVNLIERRIFGASRIGGVIGPFAVLRRRLASGLAKRCRRCGKKQKPCLNGG